MNEVKRSSKPVQSSPIKPILKTLVQLLAANGLLAAFIYFILGWDIEALQLALLASTLSWLPCTLVMLSLSLNHRIKDQAIKSNQKIMPL
ncbi:MAG: hypothetical protein HRU20_05495 [Pseudomonadales bacterium]|nr:hypothetical protein [Pseudomonadales bacterium]